MNFADRLCQAIDKNNSITVVGLDPRLESMPEELTAKHPQAKDGHPGAVALCFLEFNKAIIDVVTGKAAAIKPQVAFYEQYGWQGFRAYQETIAYARNNNLLVIADIKRGDISSTAHAYAAGHLDGPYAADAATLNPFMGSDAIKPFLDMGDNKGFFILVKTSNPSSQDLQDLQTEGESISQRVARLVVSWGKSLCGEKGYSSVGAVVGATFPEELKALREIMPRNFFLVPGYGSQGGTAEDIKNGFDTQGSAMIVNSSRGIIFAYKDKIKTGEDWREYVSDALDTMNGDLNAVR